MSAKLSSIITLELATKLYNVLGFALICGDGDIIDYENFDNILYMDTDGLTLLDNDNNIKHISNN